MSHDNPFMAPCPTCDRDYWHDEDAWFYHVSMCEYEQEQDRQREEEE